MTIDVLFENESYLVIAKPSGVMVHPDGKKDTETIVDWIRERYPRIEGVGEPMRIGETLVDRPGIVHRLDEETSGALAIAKTPEAFLHLKAQFQNHEVHKVYHAFVWGHFKDSSGMIDVPIGRNKNDFRRWHAGRGARGELREAQTAWKAERHFRDEQGQEFSFVSLYPKTGRTHQLRVHLKYIQRPIVSDHLYAPTKPDALGFSRVALHARSIAFTGLSGEKIEVVAPYPADFEHALAKYATV